MTENMYPFVEDGDMVWVAEEDLSTKQIGLIYTEFKRIWDCTPYAVKCKFIDTINKKSDTVIENNINEEMNEN
jgi:hypothetical protein